MKRKWLLAAAICVAIAFAGAARAFPGGGPPMRPPFIDALRQLNLSDAQRRAIRKVVIDHRGAFRGQRGRLHGGIERFIALDPQSADYSSEVQGFADDAATAVQKHFPALADMQAQIYEVLRADQRAQLGGLIRNARRPDVPSGPQGDEGAVEDGRGGMQQWMMPMIDELEPSDEQQARIRQILLQQRAQMQADGEAMREHLAQFASLPPDVADRPARLDALQKMFSEDARQRVLQMADTRARIDAELNEAQRQQLAAMARGRLDHGHPERFGPRR
jgi:RNA polymerase-binding transcription factor DksA